MNHRVPIARPAPGTHACLAAALALALVVAPSPAATATIAVSAERRGDTIELHAGALLEADPATAWLVLTDFDRYVEFIPDLRESRVVARHGATVTVEQSGDAELWLLRIPLRMTFEITEVRPNRLESRAVAGSLRALQSTYTLVPESSGVRLDYVGHVAPGYELFGHIEQMVVEQNVRRQFQALADEIERRSAVAAARAAPRP